MRNILDYAIRNKDITFEEYEFNEVDALVFSQLSYSDIKLGPFRSDGSVTLKDFNDKDLIEKISKINWTPKNDIKLWQIITTSERYKNLKIVDFLEPENYGEYGQFTGMVVEINAGLHLIIFRGTDSSFEGWEESLTMSFEPEIGAHIAAKSYFELISKKYEGEFIMAGHSKGGNLVVFAASTAPIEVQERIIKVYDFDGPGFLDEFYERDDYNSISEKLVKYIPKQSIFGLMLKSEGDIFVINSKGLLVEEHYPFNWLIEGHYFERVGEVEAISKHSYSAGNKWLQTINREERKQIIRILFELFKKCGVKDFQEMLDNKWSSIMGLKGAIDSTDPEARKILKDSFSVYLEILRKEIFKF